MYVCGVKISQSQMITVMLDVGNSIHATLQYVAAVSALFLLGHTNDEWSLVEH